MTIFKKYYWITSRILF